MSTIFTIGHSNHNSDKFLGMLSKHNVEAIADVRSTPYSRHCPHFNQDRLKAALHKSGFEYIFMGKSLGGRPQSGTLYDSQGRADYRRIAQTPEFLEGAETLLHMAESRTVAVLCAEREPHDCHRALLVARELHQLGHDLVHIHGQAGDLLEHHTLVKSLMNKWGTKDPHKAMDDQAQKVAYRRQRR